MAPKRSHFLTLTTVLASTWSTCKLLTIIYLHVKVVLVSVWSTDTDTKPEAEILTHTDSDTSIGCSLILVINFISGVIHKLSLSWSWDEEAQNRSGWSEYLRRNSLREGRHYVFRGLKIRIQAFIFFIFICSLSLSYHPDPSMTFRLQFTAVVVTRIPTHTHNQS